jgi:serine/threonine protein kinase
MKQIKHYKIRKLVGSGGMGEVYKAFDTVLERDVAIKIVHRHLLGDEKTDARFMREAWVRPSTGMRKPNESNRQRPSKTLPGASGPGQPWC